MTRHLDRLTPAIDAFRTVQEATIVGLAEKYERPVAEVAHRCAHATLQILQDINDASVIVVTHATTPTADIPVHIIKTPETTPVTAPFLLLQERLIETPIVLTSAEIIEATYDADANPTDQGTDMRKLALKPENPDFTFEPVPDQVPINYMCPTPTPEDRGAYQHLAMQTLPCPPPIIEEDE